MRILFHNQPGTKGGLYIGDAIERRKTCKDTVDGAN